MSQENLTPDQKDFMEMGIRKVRIEPKIMEEYANLPIHVFVENYLEKKAEIIKKMEANTDPVFLEVLNYAKNHLTTDEFNSIQIEIYAACNKIAMEHRTPVDHIAHLFKFTNPPPQ